MFVTNQQSVDAPDGAVQRRSSILSFQNLSIDGGLSACDSQFSHYNPSINEPFVPDDASAEEREMHAFLDAAGVFQVNVKGQLAEEQKASIAPSPTLNQHLSQMRVKHSSPSFMERRR